MDPWEVAAWPWTVMAVSRTGAIYLSRPLAELLGIEAVPPPNWAERFEFWTPASEVVQEPALPWRRAAQGELFTDRQVWVHRQQDVRYAFRLEAAPVGDFVVIRFEDESERLLGRRIAARLDPLAAALLRADPTVLAREVAACVDAEAAFFLEPDPECNELRWVTAVGLPNRFAEGMEPLLIASSSQISKASRGLELTEIPRLETEAAHCPVARRLLQLGFRSLVALPLASDRSPAAVLAVARRKTGKDPAVERALLRGMRAALLRAFSRAREEAADREAHARVRRVQDAAGSVHGELPFNELLSQMAEQARALTQAERATLDVGRERHALTPRLPTPPLPAWLLSVPLKLGSEVMGHFRLEKSPSAVPFTREDAHRLASFAAQVAPVVGYAREAQWADAERLFLDSVLRQAPDGILFVDTRNEPGTISSNAAAERILGQPLASSRVDELPLKFGLHDVNGRLLTPEELPQRRALRGETVLNQDILVRRKDGEEVMVRANAAPVRSVTGNRLGAVVVFQDISAFRALDRLREEFAAVLAHDLRTPLHAILLRLERLERAVEGRERTTVGQLRASGERLVRLVNELADASRLEMKALEIHREEMFLEPAIRSLLEGLEPIFEGRAVRLDAEGELPAMQLDAVRIDQILTNLVTNGVKHSKPGGVIDIRVRPEGAGVRIEVQDHGEGIPAEDLPRVFDRFFQGGRGRGEKRGMGLGLFITQRLVEAHGGQVGVRSTLGEGSTFWVWLPALPPPA